MKASAVSIDCLLSSNTIRPLYKYQRRFNRRFANHRVGPTKTHLAVKAVAFQLVQSTGKTFDAVSLFQIRGIRDGLACVFATSAAMVLVKSINYLASKEFLDTVSLIAIAASWAPRARGLTLVLVPFFSP